MSSMMRYKSIDYSCGCCSSPGKGKERAEENRQIQAEIDEELNDLLDSE